MPTERLAIVGTGGHAKVVVDALRTLDWQVEALDFYSENELEIGGQIAGRPIRHLASATLDEQLFHVAIGNNAVRRRIAETASAAGGLALSIVHPRAIVSRASHIGAGCFIAAGAIVGPDAELGAGCIANHGSVTDHDCRVGDYCHIAPGATLGGGVVLLADVLIGAGANVLPRVTIGLGSIIGAGAVAHRDVPAHATYAGVPARQLPE